MPLELIPPGKRKGSPYYYARGTVKGRRIERSLKTSVRRIALDRLHDLERELEQGPQTTFADAAARYMRDGGERRYMIPVLRYFGADTLVKDITPQVIDEAGRKLYPHVKPATRRRQATTPIRAVLNHYERGGMRQPTTDQTRTRWLTPEEAERLIVAARQVDAESKKPSGCERLILTLLGTGCRTSELVKLQMENINERTGQIWIADPKNGRPRWVSVEPRRSLASLLSNLGAHGPAFKTPKGAGYTIRSNNSGGQFAGIFNKARATAGLGSDVTPHVCRHTWATWFYAASGHNLAALMSNGGWVKTEMAMRYTKLAPSDLAEQLRNYGWNFGNGENAGNNSTKGKIYAVK